MAKDTLTNMLTDDLTPLQKKYILNKFDPKNEEDLSEQGLKTFIEKSKEAFEADAKLFNFNNTDNSKDKSGIDKDTNNSKNENLSVEDKALEVIGV